MPLGVIWTVKSGSRRREQGTSDPALPFRKLNDGVTPVIIGSNDWAAAWAINEQGDPMYPLGVVGQGNGNGKWPFDLASTLLCMF